MLRPGLSSSVPLPRLMFSAFVVDLRSSSTLARSTSDLMTRFLTGAFMLIFCSDFLRLTAVSTSTATLPACSAVSSRVGASGQGRWWTLLASSLKYLW